MKYEEAFKKYGDYKTASFLIKNDGALVALSEVNFHGGTCDCCTEVNTSKNQEVVRIVDIETMEILYDKEAGNE